MHHLLQWLRLLGVTIAAALLSLLLQGCTAAARQTAGCIATRAAYRCAPQCIACVRGVAKECQSEAGVPVGERAAAIAAPPSCTAPAPSQPR